MKHSSRQSIVTRVKRAAEGASATLFLVAAIVTVVLVSLYAQKGDGLSFIPTSAAALAPVRSDSLALQTDLSQLKLVQGSNGELYLKVSLTPPEIENRLEVRPPCDIVVVLDHSGSMSEENKLPFAKAALRSLLDRLAPNDRFALVGFDSSSSVLATLQPVTAHTKATILETIGRIQPGSGTNLSAGLMNAEKLLSKADGDLERKRVRKVLLLSDGEANEGVTHPGSLADMAASTSSRGTILSTIGMGLGFNESLMQSLADHGMGSYAYLEHLSGLDAVLTKDLDDARSIYAQTSTLELKLRPGVQVVDASGYPIKAQGTGSFQIPVGQIIGGRERSFTVALRVPTNLQQRLDIGEVALNYSVAGKIEPQSTPSRPLLVEVVAPDRSAEARQSVNAAVFEESWIENNFGRMERELQQALKGGDQTRAQQAISDYRRGLADAESTTRMPLTKPEVRSKLASAEAQVKDAFEGAPAEQGLKQNRFAKEALKSATISQRKTK